MSQAHEIAERLSWVAVDWGSSNLRAWALDARGEVLARTDSDRGMLTLTPEAYEAELLRVIGDWLPATGRKPVRICGMAGARQGWREAAYLPVPTRLDDLARGAVAPPLDDPRLEVALLPGLCQTAEGAFDVMRGEETQLAGLVAREPGFTGLACLPGTHAKWARLEAGAVTRFTTCLTGELYRLLARQSVLKHSIGDDDLMDPGCREAFLAAVHEIQAAPATYTARLFGLRAQDLLDTGLPTGEARGARLAARLSGLTIGLELAGMGDELGDELADAGPVTLIGNAALCERYALALEALGHTSRHLDGEAAVLAGLGLAHHGLAARR
ncbi:2-dehydro-3-deoxygalactonokinase [Halomonas ramblicola]|uniref:2-dehydro-3-deoxygalactonokinase n=1 Tax=Halomonas ramblicola TaxID=747349 RepID=UPI0025B2EDD2|nr:2-dehydro-3-deoxygalactonokinase [Halomonas ramblicola]MDN3521820.1 2-dehydro-3-deoxygalactonokinase [Halomonas ramblicola]